MADTIQVYNQTAKLFAAGEVSLTGIRVMLLNDSATFDASHTQISQLSANEVSGNGWDAGGELLSNVSVTTVTTNDAALDADDLIVAASGGSIGPAYKAALYDSTNSPGAVLAFITFDVGTAPQTATVGNNFVITWNASGIFTWTVT